MFEEPAANPDEFVVCHVVERLEGRPADHLPDQVGGGGYVLHVTEFVRMMTDAITAANKKHHRGNMLCCHCAVVERAAVRHGQFGQARKLIAQTRIHWTGRYRLGELNLMRELTPPANFFDHP